MCIRRWVTRYLESQLVADGVETQVVNLGEKIFPLWDEKIWDGDEEWKALLAPTAEQLSNSDAFIFVVPEYHGMAPSALKNFLLLFSSVQFGHKPAMLVGVLSGDGGAYPLAEMRMNSAKNNRLCFDLSILKQYSTALTQVQRKWCNIRRTLSFWHVI